MSWNLVRKTVRDRWLSTVFYAAGLAAYTLMMASIYPTISGVDYEDILERMPEYFFQLFGVEKLDMTSFSNYITVEFLGFFIIIIVGAFVFTFARSIVAGEVKDGTIELLLSQPVERWEVMTSKGLVLLGGIVGLVMVVILSVYAFGAAFGIEVGYLGFLAYWPLAVAVFVAVAGYTCLLTVLSPKRGTMAAVGVTLGFYMLNFIAEAVSSLNFLKYASIFYYYKPQEVLNSASVPFRDVLVLGALGLLTFGLAVVLFQRKDIVV